MGVTDVYAESVHLTATVAAQPSDFQLVIQRIDGTGPISANDEMVFAIIYGSNLPNQTDILVLEARWHKGQVVGSGELVDIVSFVPGSATNALGGNAPVVDTVNRKITWQISPMPPVNNQMVIWKLKAGQVNFDGSQAIFDVTARLIGPGTEKSSSPITTTYFKSGTPTPTPTPTATPTPTVTPTPTLLPTPEITPTPLPTATPIIDTPHPTEPATSTPTPTASISATPVHPDNPPTSPTAPSGSGSPPPAKAPPLNTLRPIVDVVQEIPIVGVPIKKAADGATEIAQKSGGLIAAPVPLFTGIISAIASVGALLAYAPWWQIPSLLGALFWQRRRFAWGVVFDAITKQPLDPVLLTLTDAKGGVHQTISDIYGRYQFLVEPGTYQLKVEKSHYRFPSEILNSESTDGIYHDLYYGGPIEVKDSTAINYNIPMDPIADDWNQAKKQEMGLFGELLTPKFVLNSLFWVGFIWSVIMALFALTILNAMILALYLILVTLRYVHRWRQPWGVIYDQSNRPVGSAAVHLVDLRNPQLKRPPVITNNSGRYAFLVNEGDYQVNIAIKKSYGYGAPVLGPKISITEKQGTIAHDVIITNESASERIKQDSNSPGVLFNPNSPRVKKID